MRVRLLVGVMVGLAAGVSAERPRAERPRVVATGQASAAHGSANGTVQGKLTGADGAPISSAWVAAIPSEGEVDADNPEQLTTEDGSFSLDVPPGKYFVVANYDWPATQGAPVLTTFYPGSETEAGAKVVTVTAGSKQSGLDIHVTRVLVPKSFAVEVKGADGRPVTTADAYLTQTNQAGIAGSDSGASYVDAKGAVTLTGFEGLDYLVWAEDGVGAKKICAPVMKLPKDAAPQGTITLQLTLAQPACSQQEDAARKAAYAMQAR